MWWYIQIKDLQILSCNLGYWKTKAINFWNKNSAWGYTIFERHIEASPEKKMLNTTNNILRSLKSALLGQLKVSKYSLWLSLGQSFSKANKWMIDSLSHTLPRKTLLELMKDHWSRGFTLFDSKGVHCMSFTLFSIYVMALAHHLVPNIVLT